MSSKRAEQFAEGDCLPDDANEGERAIAMLVNKTVMQPTLLDPGDLAAVARHYGTTAAVDITGYLYAFHFINRIADLVGIRSDLPLIQAQWPRLRRLGVRLQSAMMRRVMDLSRCDVDVDIDAAVGGMEAVVGPLPPGFSSLRDAPNVAGLLGTVAQTAERLDPGMLQAIGRSVRAYLPANQEEATGLHQRPADPLDALVFVGTRYAARTTDELVDSVRRSRGFDDRGLLNVFFAISMHNGLERMKRLLAVPVAVSERVFSAAC